MRQVWAVVVAGGSGARFGRPKQFELLAGRPVAAWSVAACRPWCDGVVLVLPPDAGGRPDPGPTASGSFGADLVVAGGSTRSASVRQGLAAVPARATVIVVHDAARPLAGPELFAAVLGAVDDGAEAALCAVAVPDTLKRVATGPDGAAVVAATVERADLVAVQTPQAFGADLLRRAHAGAAEASDDAGLVEALGATVRVVPGSPDNFKLTTPDDLARAQHLVAR